MACVDQGSCPPLEERLRNTDYVANLWEWGNLATAAFAVVTFFVAKYMYSLPHIVQDSLDSRRRREARTVERTIRKYRRFKRHRDRTGSGTLATGIAAARFRRMLGRGHSKVSVAPDEGDDGGDAAARPPAAAPAATDAAYADAVEVLPAKPASTAGDKAGEPVGNAAGAGDGQQAGSVSADPESCAAPAPAPAREVVSAGGFVSLNVQLVLNDNSAVALSYTGYLVAYGLMLSGPRTPSVPGGDTLDDVIDLAQWTATGILLLTVSAVVTDRVLMRGFAMRGGLLTQNVAVGIVEFGSHVSCGLVVRAILSGYEFDVPIAEAYTSTALYWALGQLAFLLTTAVLHWVTPYSVGQEVKAGNPAVAIQFAGNQISSALRAFGAWPQPEAFSPHRAPACDDGAPSHSAPAPRSGDHAASAHRVAGRVRCLLRHRQRRPPGRPPAAVPRADPAAARPHGGQGGGGGPELVRSCPGAHRSRVQRSRWTLTAPATRAGANTRARRGVALVEAAVTLATAVALDPLLPKLPCPSA